MGTGSEAEHLVIMGSELNSFAAAPTTKSESPLLKLMSHWFVRTATHLKDHVSHYDSIQMSLIYLRLTSSESLRLICIES